MGSWSPFIVFKDVMKVYPSSLVLENTQIVWALMVA